MKGSTIPYIVVACLLTGFWLWAEYRASHWQALAEHRGHLLEQVESGRANVLPGEGGELVVVEGGGPLSGLFLARLQASPAAQRAAVEVLKAEATAHQSSPR